MSNARLLAAFAAAIVWSAPLCAASLQVQPVLVDVAAPGAASTLTLRNDGTRPINVQVRVFRWTQADGEERLDPTEDVVASPPAVTLAPNTDYVTRVVRVAKQPPSGEESYRLLVDELPDAAQAKTNAIRLLVRHSIPVFFGAPDRTAPVVDWSIARRSDKVIVQATNRGDLRLRISGLSARDAAGKAISFGNGLVGYALGRSTMRWTAPSGARGFAAFGSASITGQGNDGPIHATAAFLTTR